MKKFNLKPHEIGYLKLLYSTFAGLDYAVANASVGAEQAKSFKAAKTFKVIREVQIRACEGLASEYIRASLIKDKLIKNDPTLLCVFDPSDDNTDGHVEVWTREEIAANKSKNITNKEKK